MRKIWTLAYKDIYLTFTDRNLLLIMIATPLLLSTIIGVVFGGLGGDDGDFSFSQIPLVIVNQDEGATINGDAVNYGDVFTGIIAPAQMADGGEQDLFADDATCSLTTTDTNGDTQAQSTSLEALFVPTVLDDAEAARQGVRDGTYHAAIILPSQYSRSITPDYSDTEATTSDDVLAQSSIEVYVNSAQPIAGTITRAVTESITNQLVTGGVTIAATIDTLIERAQTNAAFGVRFGIASVTGNFSPEFSCAFSSSLGTIDIEQQPLNTVQQQSVFVQILIGIGSGQAVFFALFTGYQGLLTIYDERKAHTLQRLLATPTPRSYILMGKVLGSALSVLLQIVLLLFFLTLIASIVEGQAMFIWGDNVVLVAVLTLALTISVSGIGILIVGVANSAEQAQLFGPIVNTGFAALGGAFGFALPQAVAQFSPIYWGANGYVQLAQGNMDITTHLLVLTVQGLVMFAIGAYLFSRRAEI